MDIKYKKIANRVGAYVWLTNQSKKYLLQRNHVIDIFIILFTFTVSLSSIPSIIWVEDITTVKISSAIISVVTILVALIKSLQKYLNYPLVSSKFSDINQEYVILFLKLKNKESDDNLESSDELLKNELDIRSRTPSIPDQVIKSYYKVNSNGVSRESLFGNVSVVK